MKRIKKVFKLYKKFFISLGIVILSMFTLVLFLKKNTKKKTPDVFVMDGAQSCQADFYIAPVCEQISFDSKSLSSTKESAPIFNPEQEVEFDINYYNSNYKIVSIGHDESNFFQRWPNLQNGDKVTLPQEEGYYYIATNMYDDTNCGILCTGETYEAIDQYKCLEEGNFVDTGRTCVNDCKGWIKVEKPGPIDNFQCNNLSLTVNGRNVESGESVYLGEEITMTITDATDNTQRTFQYMYEAEENATWKAIERTMGNSVSFAPTMRGTLRLAVNLFDPLTCTFCGHWQNGYYCPNNDNCNAMKEEEMGEGCGTSSNCSNACGIIIEVE